MVYAYGTSADVFGLVTPGFSSATCNLDVSIQFCQNLNTVALTFCRQVFCFAHPCLCVNNSEKKGCVVYGGSVLGRKAGEVAEEVAVEQEDEREFEELDDKQPLRKPLRNGGMKKYLSDIYLPAINWYETPVFGCRPDFGYVLCEPQYSYDSHSLIKMLRAH